MASKLAEVQAKIDNPDGPMGDDLFNNIFGDYIEFFNNLIVGQKKPDHEDCASLILSANSISSTQDSVSKIFSEHSSENTQNSETKQNIILNCGTRPLTEVELVERGQKTNIFGMVDEDSGCQRVGCCYNIDQVANSSVVAINSNITNRSSEMYNKIEENLTSRNDIETRSNCNLIALNQSINNSRSESVEKIHEILTEASSVNVDVNQDIEIISQEPLMCVNECDEPPSAGDIKQSINIDIHSQNIVSSTFKKIVDNYTKLDTDSKFSYSDVPKARLYIYSLLSVLVFSIIYLSIFYGLKFVVTIVIKITPPVIAVHAVSFVVFLIVLLIYAINVCYSRDKLEPFCFAKR